MGVFEKFFESSREDLAGFNMSHELNWWEICKDCILYCYLFKPMLWDICYQYVIFATVNNAGVGLIGPIECQSIEDMQGVFETNFYGVVRMIKEVLPDMKKRRSGHILVMSSVMGLQGMHISKNEFVLNTSSGLCRQSSSPHIPHLACGCSECRRLPVYIQMQSFKNSCTLG